MSRWARRSRRCLAQCAPPPAPPLSRSPRCCSAAAPSQSPSRHPPSPPGGNSGIGVETVRALAHAGADVTLCSRSAEAGQRVAADLQPGVKVRAWLSRWSFSWGVCVQQGLLNSSWRACPVLSLALAALGARVSRPAAANRLPTAAAPACTGPLRCLKATRRAV